MKLLFITQKIHEDDDDLAFVVLWIKQFIREVFDKFIVKQHFDKIHKDLRAETYSIFDEVKRYLKAVKYD